MSYYCLHKLHWKPTDILAMSREEKAFTLAAIEIKAEHEKKEQAKLRTKKPRKRK